MITLERPKGHEVLKQAARGKKHVYVAVNGNGILSINRELDVSKWSIYICCRCLGHLNPSSMHYHAKQGWDARAEYFEHSPWKDNPYALWSYDQLCHVPILCRLPGIMDAETCAAFFFAYAGWEARRFWYELPHKEFESNPHITIG